MTIDSEILQTVSTMPEPLKQELLHYAKYLIENYSKDITSAQTPQKKRKAGLLKGKIWMSNDFDEPLEDFKDYM
jgi:hypothetical protein